MAAVHRFDLIAKWSKLYAEVISDIDNCGSSSDESPITNLLLFTNFQIITNNKKLKIFYFVRIIECV